MAVNIKTKENNFVFIAAVYYLNYLSNSFYESGRSVDKFDYCLSFRKLAIGIILLNLRTKKVLR
jgi:hypothetical protein